MSATHDTTRHETVISDSTLRSMMLWGTLVAGIFSFGVSVGAARMVVNQKADREELQLLRADLQRSTDADANALLRIERDISAVREGVTDLTLRVRALVCSTSSNPSACR